MRARDIPARDRLMAKLEPQSNGCWYWTGIIDAEGYGRVGYKGRRSETIQRAVYDCFIGPIQEGFQVDHTCHSQDPGCTGGPTCLHRRCGNPEHLEAVSGAENVTRAHRGRRLATSCKNGHPYTADNTYVRRCDGKRLCIECYTRRHGSPPVKAVKV